MTQAEEVFQEASELGVPPEDPTSIQTLPWTAPWRSWAPQTADEGPGPAASARRGGGQGAGPAADGRPGNGSAGGGKGSSGSRKKSSHAGHVVAVKVQYPNALQLMQIDLKQIRRMASFLTQVRAALGQGPVWRMLRVAPPSRSLRPLAV